MKKKASKATGKAKKIVHKKPVAKKKPVGKKPAKKQVIQKKTRFVAKPSAKAAPVKKVLPAKLVSRKLPSLPKAVPLAEIQEEKKPKGFYTLEYRVNSSPDILFEFISTADGLEKWFADKVSVKENLFHFFWGKDEEKQASLIAIQEKAFARFHWADQPDNKKYFEFRIQIDDLTSEVALIVSDFANGKEEYEEARRLWDAQMQDLLHAIGGGS